MCGSSVKLVIVTIILVTRITVFCVTSSPNLTVPFFPTEQAQTGRGYSAEHTRDNPYNNMYNNVDNNDNIYNTIEFSEHKLYSSLLNSGDNTLDNNMYNPPADNNMYNPPADNNGDAQGGSAANEFFPSYQHQGGQYQPPNVRTRKGYGYYPGYGPPHNPYYYQQGVPPNCFNDMSSFFHLGTSKLGILGLLKAGFGTLLSHVPYVFVKFLAKFALVKLGFLLLGTPLVIPLIVPLLSLYLPFLANKFSPCCGGGGGGDDDDGYKNNSTVRVRFEGEDQGFEGDGYERAVGRAMKTLLDSDRCYEKIACQLGRANAKSEYNRPIMWVMMSMLKTGSEQERSRLRSFKDAYTRGNQEESCGSEIYQCHFEKLAESFQK